MIPSLTDSFARSISYLRLSVTDKCQFRCFYCVPPEGAPAFPRQDYLTPEEMELFVRAVAQMGIWRLRLTGGEPLLRKDIVELVARFSSVPGISDLALTTNGEHLARLAPLLKEAGLHRMNISLDSLDPKRFQHITKSSSYFKVWEGIHASLEVGLKVKINTVVFQGMTHKEMDGFFELAHRFPLEVRFIEFMPLCGTGWKPELVLPMESVRKRLTQSYSLKPLPRGSEVAESYEIQGGQGRVGFIGSMTEPFCSKCSRLRMSATGKIQLCLFSPVQYNVAPLLKGGVSLEEIQKELRNLVFKKPEKHPYHGEGRRQTRAAHGLMQAIGG